MGSVSGFSEETALATFDKLVSEGIINYGASFPTYQTVDGFEFEFRHRPSWQSKPRIPTDSSTSSPSTTTEKEYFGPGSDILKSHPSQVLALLGETHILALNIFPSSRPHYLILTGDSYARQDQVLNVSDIEVAWNFLLSLNKPENYYIMYNCGPASGCSRKHKHLQVARKPESTTLWPDLTEGLPPKMAVNVPYRANQAYFDLDLKSSRSNSVLWNFRIPAEELYVSYLRGLESCRDLLGSPCDNDNDWSPPHNLILTTEWMVVIPRRLPEDESYMELLPNGAGMMGMVSSPRKEVLDRWVCRGAGEGVGHVWRSAPPKEGREDRA